VAGVLAQLAGALEAGLAWPAAVALVASPDRSHCAEGGQRSPPGRAAKTWTRCLKGCAPRESGRPTRSHCLPSAALAELLASSVSPPPPATHAAV
jgi:hypothetical protein